MAKAHKSSFITNGSIEPAILLTALPISKKEDKIQSRTSFSILFKRSAEITEKNAIKPIILTEASALFAIASAMDRPFGATVALVTKAE